MTVHLCRRRLVEVGGRASSIRSQEITELQSVAVAQHLEVNPFAKAARAQRSTLGLCTYSFELLMHQLQGSKQWLILNIINQHIRFEVGGAGGAICGVLLKGSLHVGRFTALSWFILSVATSAISMFDSCCD